MRFNLEDYQGNYAMHCKTLIEAQSFCAYLHGQGRTWSDGREYIGRNQWNSYQENSCYDFNVGRYSNLNYFKTSDFTVLEWADFMYDTPAGRIDNNNDYYAEMIIIAGMEFFKLPEENGIIPIIAVESVFGDCFNEAREHNNNFAQSQLLKRLIEETLPMIENAVGADNVIYFETDLTSVLGDKTYGTMKSKISLPTLDLMRNNHNIFNKYHKKCTYWWLATPYSIEKKNACIMSEDEYLYAESPRCTYRVRPVLHIKAEALTVQN